MNASPEKERAHELIDRLPPSELPTAVRFLEFILLDPVARSAATAPADEEPLTEEDGQRLIEGEAWFAKRGGKGIPTEEVLAEFGLTMEDFPLDNKNKQ
jgi:hypothetical protein